MSNHDGSYMLNEVLHLLEKYGFFEVLEKFGAFKEPKKNSVVKNCR
ncbi:MAG: hypothetical protein JSS07_10440 [Proteobacteria bacterium]|nr:hypothetical protein [Pseudomonadota bacterium]